MLVIGLTGGIGMGKSAAAERFAEHGIPVFNADLCVHQLYEGAAVAPDRGRVSGRHARGTRRPQAAVRADRRIARAPRVCSNRSCIPWWSRPSSTFSARAGKEGATLAVLEIPLLFETGADARVDVTSWSSAPHDVQRARVLARPGMTVDKLEHLLARQLPDAERRARADFVVDSGTSLEDMRIEIDKLIELLKSREGRVMDRLRRKD